MVQSFMDEGHGQSFAGFVQSFSLKKGWFHRVTEALTRLAGLCKGRHRSYIRIGLGLEP